LNKSPSASFATIVREDCIGEMENRVVDDDMETPQSEDQNSRSNKTHSHPVFKYRYTRTPIKIVFTDTSAADERYGGSGDKAIIEGELIKADTNTKSVIIFMHPSGIQNLLPMPNAMARAGLHVVTCTSRYPNNDSCLVMEKVVLDLGACIRHMKEKFGYQKVLLAGWSGGGSLSSFYQAQAESPTITHTPAGDLVDLTNANLIPGDGLLIMAAHISRAKIFTEWLDPAVLDENDPSKRDVELDLYDPNNPNVPPFSPEYVKRFREAQIARNRRITKWAENQLENINEDYESVKVGWKQNKRDQAFLVSCTQADIRRIDTSIDPNGRSPTQLSDLAAENHSPVGLARFTTLRSWLSQWSYDKSNAEGPKSLAKITVPVMVVANEADHLVPLSHPEAMYKAVKHDRKKFHLVKGATHYYFGQNDLMASAVKEVMIWLCDQGLLESAFLSA